jgi:hypothetical protein
MHSKKARCMTGSFLGPLADTWLASTYTVLWSTNHEVMGKKGKMIISQGFCNSATAVEA